MNIRYRLDVLDVRWHWYGKHIRCFFAIHHYEPSNFGSVMICSRCHCIRRPM